MTCLGFIGLVVKNDHKTLSCQAGSVPWPSADAIGSRFGGVCRTQLVDILRFKTAEPLQRLAGLVAFFR